MKVRLCGLLALLISLLAGGCPQLALLPVDVPPAGDATLAERLLAENAAAQTAPAPPSDRTTVRSLDALAGCWARAAGPEDVPVPGADGAPTGVSVRARSVELWRFDADGRYRRELVIRSDGLPFSLLMVEEGQLDLDENSVMCLHVQRLGVRDLLGNLTLEPVRPETSANPICWDVRIAGDQIVLTGPLDEHGASDAEAVAYQRVECQ